MANGYATTPEEEARLCPFCGHGFSSHHDGRDPNGGWPYHSCDQPMACKNDEACGCRPTTPQIARLRDVMGGRS